MPEDGENDIAKLQKEIEKEKQSLLMLSMQIEKDIETQYSTLDVKKGKLNESAKKLAKVAEKVTSEKTKLISSLKLLPVYKKVLKEIKQKHPDVVTEACMDTGLSPEEFKSLEKSIE